MNSTLSNAESLQKIFIDAIQHNNISVIKLLVQNKIEITANIYHAAKKAEDEQIYQLVVQPYHARKKQLIHEGPVLSLDTSAKNSPTLEQALLSRTFVEKSTKKSMLRTGVAEMVKQPLLQDVFGHCCIGSIE